MKIGKWNIISFYFISTFFLLYLIFSDRKFIAAVRWKAIFSKHYRKHWLVNNPQFKWVFLNDTSLAFIIVLLFDYIILFLAIDKLFFFLSLKQYFYYRKHRLNLELKWESVNINLLIFIIFLFSADINSFLARVYVLF